MRTLNLLVLGVGGNVSQGIIKALAVSNLEYKLTGACVTSSNAGFYFCDYACMAPYANDPGFLPWLVELCNKNAIDMVFTGVEENIIAIAKEMAYFKANTKAIFVASDYQNIVIGQDKLLTSRWLRNNDCNYPEFVESGELEAAKRLLDMVGFPLIAKPRKGKGSMGITIISSMEQLQKAVQLPDYVIQECVGTEDTEYTVGAYCDKTGRLVETIVMHRTLLHGATQTATIVRNETIESEACKICNAFNPRGPLNMQMRIAKDGRPVCFELNVRFSGTTPMRARFGFNDVKAVICEYLFGLPVDSVFNVTAGTAYRYTNELYVTSEIVFKNSWESVEVPDVLFGSPR